MRKLKSIYSYPHRLTRDTAEVVHTWFVFDLSCQMINIHLRHSVDSSRENNFTVCFSLKEFFRISYMDIFTNHTYIFLLLSNFFTKRNHHIVTWLQIIQCFSIQLQCKKWENHECIWRRSQLGSVKCSSESRRDTLASFFRKTSQVSMWRRKL